MFSDAAGENPFATKKAPEGAFLVRFHCDLPFIKGTGRGRFRIKNQLHSQLFSLLPQSLILFGKR